MLDTIGQYAVLIGAVVCLAQAGDTNSVGWGSAAVCLMIYSAAWAIGGQISRALDKLDELARHLRHLTGRSA